MGYGVQRNTSAMSESMIFCMSNVADGQIGSVSKKQ